MVKKLLLLGCLLMLAGNPLSAATIHIRYFESADFALSEGTAFQIYSFAALEAEHITLVIYGLDDGLIPAVNIFDINGITMAEDLNLEQDAVAVVEMTAPANGLYTALVSRQTEVTGIVRVMLFEGAPLQPDFSFLDTIDPLLPSRVYFLSGSAEQPVEVTINVLPIANENAPDPQIFASRGTEISLPPLEERVNPIERFTWENDRGDIFYTLNVRALPETLPTSRKLQGSLSQQAQFLDLATLQVDVGAGIPEPDFLPRPICTGTVPAGTALLAGPSPAFKEVATLDRPSNLEIVGESGDYFLVIDPANPQGGSFVPKTEVNLDSDLTGEECIRVQEVTPPDLTNDNRREVPNNNNGGNTDPFGSLEPYSDLPSDAPQPNEASAAVFRAEPLPPSPPEPYTGYTSFRPFSPQLEQQRGKSAVASTLIITAMLLLMLKTWKRPQQPD